MRQTLLISVAALALAAASNVALSQGGPGGSAAPGGATAPAASPSTGGGHDGATPERRKGAQEQGAPTKQRSTQQAPESKQAPQQRGETTRSEPGQAAPRQQGQAAPNERQGRQDRGQAREERGQAREERSQQRDQRREGQAAPHQQPSQRSVEEGQQRPGAARQGTRDRTMKSSNVSLTTEQKTTIRQTVLTGSAPRVSGNINFDISVGTVIPRTVRVAPLPATIVEIEPDWRGFMYFVRGEEIIVVDPATLEIVAVLDV